MAKYHPPFSLTISPTRLSFVGMRRIGSDRFIQREEGVLLPFKLVECAHNETFLSALAFFVCLKKVQRNGVFYGASLRKLSTYTGYSHQSVKNYLNQLIKKGLVEWRKGKHGKKELALRGYKYCTSTWGRSLVLIRYGHKNEVYEQLNSQVALRHIKSQEYNIARKQGRNRKLDTLVESAENYASLSDRKLADLMGVSSTTANRFKAKWSQMGLLTFRPMWKVLSKDVSESHYITAKRYGAIPVYAIYQKSRRRILVRGADSARIGGNKAYKVTPYSWTPSFQVRSTINNIKMGTSVSI